MKVAICLYGVCKTTDIRGITVNWRAACKNVEKLLSYDSGNDYDFFIHTWNPSEEKSLKRFFNPKIIRTEASKMGDYKYNMNIESLGDTGHYNPKNKIQSIYSRWESECKSISYKREYELKNKIKYDFVLSRRFDLLFYEDFNWNLLNPNEFYSSNWHVFWTDDRNRLGYNDAWFLSGSDIMDLHSKTYENLDTYLRDDSDYTNFILNELKLPKEMTLSNHAISRYNAIHESYISNERFIGLEYDTWSLTRKSHIKHNPHWSCPWDIRVPFDPRINK